ncbi:MAG: FtsX-like permease family protein [Planctomycetota bacterium]
MSLLARSSLRYLMKHPWQALLSMLGIAIGVAVVVSIDIANQSARRAFEVSMDRVAGRATHQVVGGPVGFTETVYRIFRNELGFRKCAPVVEGYVKVKADPPRTMTLLGIDPFAENPFRAFLNDAEQVSLKEFTTLLTCPGAVFLSALSARELGVGPGDPLPLEVSGQSRQAMVAGCIRSDDEALQSGLRDLLIADIATAQELLGHVGRLSRIDLVIPDSHDGQELARRIEAHLPPGLSLVRSESRSRVAGQMMRAFDLNLTALSLLALIVGMFLIYNTMTFSVMRRKVHLGLLRSLGVTRGELFRMVLGEALFLGSVGTVIGLGLGLLMGRGLIELVSRTINDLYFVVSVRNLDLSPFVFLKGSLLGLCATFVAAFYPARAATLSPPVSVLQRSSQETDLRTRIPFLSVAGVIAVSAGVALLLVPSKNIVLGYAGLLPLILGFAWLTPLALSLFVRFAALPARKVFGLIGSMAVRGIYAQMSRTSVAVAALALAVAATVGVGTTIASFRQTVVHWLERRLEADIYISAPGWVSRRNDGDLPSGLIESIAKIPGYETMNFFREVQVQDRDRVFNVIGSHIAPRARIGFVFKEGDPDAIWPAMEEDGAVIVSEPFAYRYNMGVGDSVELPTDRGRQSFAVAGVYYDYGSDLGLVTMAHPAYLRFFDDPLLSGISVFLEPGTDEEQFMDRVRALTKGELLVRTHRVLRDSSIRIFDRTFVVANVLQLLAVIVAFIGILSALMAIQLERSRELAILRANGLTPRQMGLLVMGQSTLTGLLAGILSLPLGTILAWVLVSVINERSFGWTLRFDPQAVIFVEALALAILAAAAAGIYPALKMAATPLATALREE